MSSSGEQSPSADEQSEYMKFKNYNKPIVPTLGTNHQNSILTAMVKNDLRRPFSEATEGISNNIINNQWDWNDCAGDVLEDIDKYGAACVAVKSGTHLLGKIVIFFGSQIL